MNERDGPGERAVLTVEGRYRQIFQQNGAVQLLVEPSTGRIVEANPAAADFYGHAQATLQAMRISDFSLLPEDEVLQAAELAVSVGGHYYGFPHRLASGEVRLVEIYAGPLELDRRTLLHFIVHDVTERVEAVANLRKSEAQVRLFVEYAPAAVAMLDKAMTYVLVSQRWLADHGLGRRDLIGLSHYDIFPAGPWREVHRRCLEGAVEHCDEDLLTRADGSTEWVQWEIRPWREDTGEIGGIIIFTEIITARKLAEENARQLAAERAARKADQRAATEWQGTFDAIESAIILADEAGVIARANRRAQDLGARDNQALVGLPVRQVGPGPLWQKAGDLVDAVRARRRPESCQVRDPASGQTWELAATVYEEPGFDLRVIVVARDLTEIIRLQETLRRNERMSMMGSIAAGVAHEVRNPLFGISSTLDAFKARFPDRPEFQRYHTVLGDQVERLSALMRDLLEYGKPTTVEFAVGQLEGVLREAVRHCGPLADSAGVSVRVDVEQPLPAMRMAAGRLTQVFRNLVENAVQHTPAGRQVRLRAVAAEDRGSRWLECAVTDGGPGFSVEDLERVWEPFYTKRQGGTGLGLAIVQRIVEEHDGTVTASNDMGGGGMVRVCLPAVDS
ncbi:MAG: PAS domain S-box protein [Gemmatimonadales bacterium]|nr:PAS domain S-box protein [Gemmatimonadales bacterium]